MEAGRAEESDKYRYRMNYPCRGTCYIIYNKNFSTDMPACVGMEEDVTNAKETFKALGYSVKDFQDQTKDQMLQLMNDVSQIDHSNSASFVCVLLGRGNRSEISCTDKYVKLDNLTQKIDGYNCKKLIGKPKLFFIQVEWGADSNDETPATADSTDGEMPSRISAKADFLYAFSTIPDPKNGSWFMKPLCQMLWDFSGQLELMQIMTRVNHEVTLQKRGKKNMPCIMSMLTKDVYLPKISI